MLLKTSSNDACMDVAVQLNGRVVLYCVAVSVKLLVFHCSKDTCA